MTNYLAGLFVVAIGLALIGLQIHRSGQSKPTPGWEVSSVEVKTNYRMKAPGLKNYWIEHSDSSTVKPFRAFKYDPNAGKFTLNESFTTFQEAEDAIMKHAGKDLIPRRMAS